uniref:amine sulfotransferase-like isoform X2 n=1 Tax=Styela clava TaxID=7725 RepID=UPI0019396577|nr:amine sulfotransferase-like isoform X2 [Styela clava]
MQNNLDLNSIQLHLTEHMKKLSIATNGPEDYKGYQFMPGFGFEATKYAYDEWNIPENSVFVSSFPKTAGKFDVFDKLPHSTKVFATHLPVELFNYEKMRRSNSKMIYVMRNPKDQAVSWFHFSKKIPLPDETKKQMGEEWNKFFHNYVNGQHPQCNKEGQWYPDHIKEWMKYKNDENFLVVVYEDMKTNFQSEIRRIAKFLDVDLGHNDVANVAEVCSIKSMKEQADVEKTGFLKINVRKGEIGGWKNQFTVAQSELMDKLIKEQLGDTGIEFTYEI